MDGPEVLAVMDLNMEEMYREDARTTADGFVVERDGMVLCGSPYGTEFTNMAMVVRRCAARAVRRAVEETFREAGLACSVWTRAHADGALDDELRDEGFEELLTVPAMMLPNETPLAPRPRELELRPVADETDRRAYLSVMVPAWGVYRLEAGGSAARLPPLHS